MVAEHIVTLLAGVETTIVVGDLPASPSNVIAVQEISGPVNQEYFGCTIMQPIMRVLIRSTSYPRGAANADAVVERLHKHQDSTLMGVYLNGTPSYLGRRTDGLYEFQIMFNIQV